MKWTATVIFETPDDAKGDAVLTGLGRAINKIMNVKILRIDIEKLRHTE